MSSSLKDSQLATAFIQYLIPTTDVEDPKQDLLQDLADESVIKPGCRSKFNIDHSCMLTVFTSSDGPCVAGKL